MHSSLDAIIGRRRFLRLLARGGIALTAGGWLRSGAAHSEVAMDFSPSAITAMEFDVKYRTEVTSLPSRSRTVKVWLPLPPTDDWQEVSGLSIRSERAHETRTETLYGNRMVYVEADAAEGPFSLEANYHVVRRRAGTEKASLQPADAERKYLRLVDPVRITDEVSAFAKRVVGEEKRPSVVGRKVYDAILELLIYDREIPGCGMGDTAWVMKYKRGKCDDFHALFMAMMISRGVPVRWEQGFPLPYPSKNSERAGGLSGDCTGAHCWASFHDPDVGWIPVDASEADKRPDLREFFCGRLTPNRFKVSEGRGIRLDPAQGADPLPTFAFAYAEADGLPLIYPANYRNVIEYVIARVEVDGAASPR